MQELVKYIVSSLVGDEGKYTVELIDKEYETEIVIACEKKAIGKIIGKQGRIAKAIRSIVKAAGMRDDGKKYSVTIAEIDDIDE